MAATIISLFLLNNFIILIEFQVQTCSPASISGIDVAMAHDYDVDSATILTNKCPVFWEPVLVKTGVLLGDFWFKSRKIEIVKEFLIRSRSCPTVRTIFSYIWQLTWIPDHGPHTLHCLNSSSAEYDPLTRLGGVAGTLLRQGAIWM